MQRATPRKRKQVFPNESPPQSSKTAMVVVSSSQRDTVRRTNDRSWEDEEQVMVHHQQSKDEQMEEMIEEVEEEVEVDDEPQAEEVIEEYVDDFTIPLYAEDAHTIVHDKAGGSRRYMRSEYGSQYSTIPRLSDGHSQFGGEMQSRSSKAFRGNSSHPRPPVHLRTNDTLSAQPRARLLPVATITRHNHRYRQDDRYGQNVHQWRDEQRRKMELLDIYESLPVEKQSSFLNLVNHTGGESFARNRNRRLDMQSISRIRFPNNGEVQSQTVEVPAHLAQDGAELLISPQPNGRAKILSLVPVGEEEAACMKDKGMKEGGDEGDADTSDMPQLEADKEAIEKKRNERIDRGDRDRDGWDIMDDDDIDVENVEEDKMRMEAGADRGDEDDIPLLTNQVRRRQGIFFVPELDGYYNDSRPNFCSPKMKGGLRLCESCNVYMRKSIFYHHQRTIREHGSCSAMTPKRFECGVPECDERLPTIEKLCTHMAELHGMPTEVQEVEFNTEEEFQVFLIELESKGGNFRMSRGNKCGKSGVVRYYRCNRVSNSGKLRKNLKKLENRDEFIEMEDDEDEEVIERGILRKKAMVRTEKICTAFYRKAEFVDGRISVRFCDYHLHDDVKVKLPDGVRERIMEMLAKKLPMPVIVEVIKAQSDNFARAGSELERRIYGVNEKDVRNVYCTYLARKRREGRSDDDVGDLNEIEMRFLTAFEKAEGKVIHEVAKGSKVTLERRRRRDELRNRLSNIGRFFKTDKFIECSDAQLSTLEELFSELDQICKVPNMTRRGSLIADIEEDDEDEEVDRLDRIENVDGIEDTTTIDEGEGGQSDDVSTIVPTTSKDEGSDKERIVNNDSESQSAIELNERKRGRPRKNTESTCGSGTPLKKVPKEEPEDDLIQSPSCRTPVRTSSGRLSKPKILPGEY